MKTLRERIEASGLQLNEHFYEYAERYKALLEKWNKVHNLTGAKSSAQIDEFIADAVAPVAFLPTIKNAMDIGTGAGFPGMILAFAMPQTQFTLVEPLTKRSGFLQFVKADLGLENVEVKGVRVEQLEPNPYELITSRAVTDTQVLLRLSEPFCVKGTLLLFYKGEKVYDEVDESLNYRVIEAENRHYLIIEK